MLRPRPSEYLTKRVDPGVERQLFLLEPRVVLERLTGDTVRRWTRQPSPDASEAHVTEERMEKQRGRVPQHYIRWGDFLRQMMAGATPPAEPAGCEGRRPSPPSSSGRAHSSDRKRPEVDSLSFGRLHSVSAKTVCARQKSKDISKVNGLRKDGSIHLWDDSILPGSKPFSAVGGGATKQGGGTSSTESRPASAKSSAVDSRKCHITPSSASHPAKAGSVVILSTSKVPEPYHCTSLKLKISREAFKFSLPPAISNDYRVHKHYVLPKSAGYCGCGNKLHHDHCVPTKEERTASKQTHLYNSFSHSAEKLNRSHLPEICASGNVAPKNSLEAVTVRNSDSIRSRIDKGSESIDHSYHPGKRKAHRVLSSSDHQGDSCKATFPPAAPVDIPALGGSSCSVRTGRPQGAPPEGDTLVANKSHSTGRYERSDDCSSLQLKVSSSKRKSSDGKSASKSKEAAERRLSNNTEFVVSDSERSCCNASKSSKNHLLKKGISSDDELLKKTMSPEGHSSNKTKSSEGQSSAKPKSTDGHSSNKGKSFDGYSSSESKLSDSHSSAKSKSSDGQTSNKSKSSDSHSSNKSKSTDTHSSNQSKSSDSYSSTMSKLSDGQSLNKSKSSDNHSSAKSKSSDNHTSAKSKSSDGQTLNKSKSLDSHSSNKRMSSDSHSSNKSMPSDSHSSNKSMSSDSHSSNKSKSSDSYSSTKSKLSNGQSSTTSKLSDGQSSTKSKLSDSHCVTKSKVIDGQSSTKSKSPNSHSVTKGKSSDSHSSTKSKSSVSHSVIKGKVIDGQSSTKSKSSDSHSVTKSKVIDGQSSTKSKSSDSHSVTKGKSSDSHSSTKNNSSDGQSSTKSKSSDSHSVTKGKSSDSHSSTKGKSSDSHSSTKSNSSDGQSSTKSKLFDGYSSSESNLTNGQSLSKSKSSDGQSLSKSKSSDGQSSSIKKSSDDNISILRKSSFGHPPGESSLSSRKSKSCDSRSSQNQPSMKAKSPACADNSPISTCANESLNNSKLFEGHTSSKSKFCASIKEPDTSGCLVSTPCEIKSLNLSTSCDGQASAKGNSSEDHSLNRVSLYASSENTDNCDVTPKCDAQSTSSRENKSSLHSSSRKRLFHGRLSGRSKLPPKSDQHVLEKRVKSHHQCPSKRISEWGSLIDCKNQDSTCDRNTSEPSLPSVKLTNGTCGRSHGKVTSSLSEEDIQGNCSENKSAVGSSGEKTFQMNTTEEEGKRLNCNSLKNALYSTSDSPDRLLVNVVNTSLHVGVVDQQCDTIKPSPTSDGSDRLLVNVVNTSLHVGVVDQQCDTIKPSPTSDGSDRLLVNVVNTSLHVGVVDQQCDTIKPHQDCVQKSRQLEVPVDASCWSRQPNCPSPVFNAPNTWPKRKAACVAFEKAVKKIRRTQSSHGPFTCTFGGGSTSGGNNVANARLSSIGTKSLSNTRQSTTKSSRRYKRRRKLKSHGSSKVHAHSQLCTKKCKLGTVGHTSVHTNPKLNRSQTLGPKTGKNKPRLKKTQHNTKHKYRGGEESYRQQLQEYKDRCRSWPGKVLSMPAGSVHRRSAEPSARVNVSSARALGSEEVKTMALDAEVTSVPQRRVAKFLAFGKWSLGQRWTSIAGENKTVFCGTKIPCSSFPIKKHQQREQNTDKSCPLKRKLSEDPNVCISSDKKTKSVLEGNTDGNMDMSLEISKQELFQSLLKTVRSGCPEESNFMNLEYQSEDIDTGGITTVTSVCFEMDKENRILRTLVDSETSKSENNTSFKHRPLNDQCEPTTDTNPDASVTHSNNDPVAGRSVAPSVPALQVCSDQIAGQHPTHSEEERVHLAERGSKDCTVINCKTPADKLSPSRDSFQSPPKDTLHGQMTADSSTATHSVNVSPSSMAARVSFPIMDHVSVPDSSLVSQKDTSPVEMVASRMECAGADTPIDSVKGSNSLEDANVGKSSGPVIRESSRHQERPQVFNEVAASAVVQCSLEESIAESSAIGSGVVATDPSSKVTAASPPPPDFEDPMEPSFVLPSAPVPYDALMEPEYLNCSLNVGSPFPQQLRKIRDGTGTVRPEENSSLKQMSLEKQRIITSQAEPAVTSGKSIITTLQSVVEGIRRDEPALGTVSPRSLWGKIRCRDPRTLMKVPQVGHTSPSPVMNPLPQPSLDWPQTAHKRSQARPTTEGNARRSSTDGNDGRYVVLDHELLMSLVHIILLTNNLIMKIIQYPSYSHVLYCKFCEEVLPKSIKLALRSIVKCYVMDHLIKQLLAVKAISERSSIVHMLESYIMFISGSIHITAFLSHHNSLNKTASAQDPQQRFVPALLWKRGNSCAPSEPQTNHSANFEQPSGPGLGRLQQNGQSVSETTLSDRPNVRQSSSNLEPMSTAVSRSTDQSHGSSSVNSLRPSTLGLHSANRHWLNQYCGSPTAPPLNQYQTVQSVVSRPCAGASGERFLFHQQTVSRAFLVPAGGQGSRPSTTDPDVSMAMLNRYQERVQLSSVNRTLVMPADRVLSTENSNALPVQGVAVSNIHSDWFQNSNSLVAQPTNPSFPVAQSMGQVSCFQQPAQQMYVPQPVSQTYVPETVSQDAYVSQPVSHNAYMSQPVSHNAYVSQPMRHTGYMSQPASQNAYVSQPVSQNDYISQPVSQNGYISQPVSQNGYVSQPTSQNAYVSQPLSQNGYLSQPVSQNAYMPQLRSQNAYVSQPASQETCGTVAASQKSVIPQPTSQACISHSIGQNSYVSQTANQSSFVPNTVNAVSWTPQTLNQNVSMPDSVPVSSPTQSYGVALASRSESSTYRQYPSVMHQASSHQHDSEPGQKKQSRAKRGWGKLVVQAGVSDATVATPSPTEVVSRYRNPDQSVGDARTGSRQPRDLPAQGSGAPKRKTSDSSNLSGSTAALSVQPEVDSGLPSVARNISGASATRVGTDKRSPSYDTSVAASQVSNGTHSNDPLPLRPMPMAIPIPENYVPARPMCDTTANQMRRDVPAQGVGSAGITIGSLSNAAGDESQENCITANIYRDADNYPGNISHRLTGACIRKPSTSGLAKQGPHQQGSVAIAPTEVVTRHSAGESMANGSVDQQTRSGPSTGSLQVNASASNGSQNIPVVSKVGVTVKKAFCSTEPKTTSREHMVESGQSTTTNNQVASQNQFLPDLPFLLQSGTQTPSDKQENNKKSTPCMKTGTTARDLPISDASNDCEALIDATASPVESTHSSSNQQARLRKELEDAIRLLENLEALKAGGSVQSSDTVETVRQTQDHIEKVAPRLADSQPSTMKTKCDPDQSFVVIPLCNLPELGVTVGTITPIDQTAIAEIHEVASGANGKDQPTSAASCAAAALRDVPEAGVVLPTQRHDEPRPPSLSLCSVDGQHPKGLGSSGSLGREKERSRRESVSRDIFLGRCPLIASKLHLRRIARVRQLSSPSDGTTTPGSESPGSLSVSTASRNEQAEDDELQQTVAALPEKDEVIVITSDDETDTENDSSPTESNAQENTAQMVAKVNERGVRTISRDSGFHGGSSPRDLLPWEYLTCDYCVLEIVSGVGLPCTSCMRQQYCSQVCRDKDWSLTHWSECQSMQENKNRAVVR